jgi:hypothetical protein
MTPGYLLEQRLHKLPLRHSPYRTTPGEDHTLALAARDTKICFSRLTRPIDHASHHGHLQVQTGLLQAPFHFLRQRLEVDARAAARGT